MKPRTRKLLAKRATFGRGPHYLFILKLRKDMEQCVFFGIPMRVATKFSCMGTVTGRMSCHEGELK